MGNLGACELKLNLGVGEILLDESLGINKQNLLHKIMTQWMLQACVPLLGTNKLIQFDHT